MPAPKRANTAAATAAAAVAAKRRKLEAAAELLRAAGWFIATPEEIAKIESEGWGPLRICEWYAAKTDQVGA